MLRESPRAPPIGLRTNRESNFAGNLNMNQFQFKMILRLAKDLIASRFSVISVAAYEKYR